MQVKKTEMKKSNSRKNLDKEIDLSKTPEPNLKDKLTKSASKENK